MASRYKAIKVHGKKCDEHRFIMEQYVGRKLSPNEVVHHKNGDPTDNRIENLEVMSRSEHSRYHGYLNPPGAKALAASLEVTRGKPCLRGRKLTPDDVLHIREALSQGVGLRALAREYGVTHCIISRIKKGIAYRDVPDVA